MVSSLAVASTAASIVLSTHFWWILRKRGSDYSDAFSFLTQPRDVATKSARLYAQKARIRLFNIVSRICIQSTLACAILVSMLSVNICGTGELQLLMLILMYTGCLAVASEVVSLTPGSCDAVAALGHFLLLALAVCPASDADVFVGGARALLRALCGILFLNARKALSANLAMSVAYVVSKAISTNSSGCSIFAAACSEALCIVQVMFVLILVQKLVEESASLRIESVEVAGKSQARKNLLSVLVDADVMLDSSLCVCQPSNKAEHFFGPELDSNETSVGGLKLYQFVAEADQSKLKEFLNRATINTVNDGADVLSESSISLQGGGSPASSLSIQLGKSGRVVQIFHASVPAADFALRSQPQPRHLVGIQESFSMSRHDFREVPALDVPMDNSTDAELMMLDCKDSSPTIGQWTALSLDRSGLQALDPEVRETPTGRNLQAAGSASSLRSSVAGLPEVGSISFIFNGYSEGLDIVEAILRFDTLHGKDEPARVPEMKHWIRSKCWDNFRNWVQMETQRCCAGVSVEEVRSFEGPLEFYYPGQPDMTLVSGSVNVVRIQGDGDSDDEEGEEEDPVCDPEMSSSSRRMAPRTVTSGSEQAGSQSADSLGGNASPLDQSEDEAQVQVYDNPLIDGDVNEEVDALLVDARRHGGEAGNRRQQLPTEPPASHILTPHLSEGLGGQSLWRKALAACYAELPAESPRNIATDISTWWSELAAKVALSCSFQALLEWRFRELSWSAGKLLLLELCAACTLCSYPKAGATYRLLNQGVSKLDLQIQSEILAAAFGKDPTSVLDAGATSRILRTVHTWKDKLGAVNASTALHLLAQSSQSTDALPRLHQESAELVLSTVAGNAQPRDLAIASWAAARLRLERAGCADRALQALNIAALACAARMDGQDMANIAWAFATMQLQAEELLTVLAEEASTKLQQFEPKHMVVLTWALAKAKVRSEDFCWAAASETQRSKASKWMPQDISNFLWANAVLRCEAPVPMEILAARAADLHWKQFRPQELSISMWGAYTLGVHGRGPTTRAVKRMLQHAAREIRTSGAQDFEPRHIINAAWSLARWQRHCRLMGWPQELKPYVCRPALRVLLGEAARDLQKFAARELSRLMWAGASQSCLKLRELGPPLLQYVRTSRAAEFDTDDLVSLVNSLAWMLERLVWEAPGRRTKSMLPQLYPRMPCTPMSDTARLLQGRRPAAPIL
ncbi:slc44a2 [Symbiodinium sp. CCMP2456]|nr:slc44a2 [Symbiodinium sp. CCMP2456]